MAKSFPKKRINKISELLILSISLVIALLLWDTYFIYPVKMFVILLHELSHAFVALITAGSIKEASIGFDLGGRIIADGGNEIAICSSGYIGSLIIGLLLFISADRTGYGKYFFYFLAGIVLITLANSNPTLSFMLLSFGVISCLTLTGMFIQNTFVALFAKAVALASAMYILIDIKDDLFTNSLSSDAIILSNLTGINSSLIGIAWLAVSLLALFVMLKLVYFGKKK